MNKPHLVLGLGELLWDMLPGGPQLGGAPANFTVMTGRLGNHAVLLSRIGRDALGTRAIEILEPLPVDASSIQVDPEHETGRVTVRFEDGQPHYTIHQPAAWDFLELSDEWVNLAERADAICFGSLAQRNGDSRSAIQKLVGLTQEKCIRLFDVNLRPPNFSSEVIQESLELATVLKMNNAEVPQVLAFLGIHAECELRLGAERLLAEFPSLKMVAITRGDHGSLLVRRDGWHEHPGIPTTVVDTIGAGDAFTAAMTHYMLKGADIETINEAGNRWGSWVASHSGAMPELREDVRIGIEATIED